MGYAEVDRVSVLNLTSGDAPQLSGRRSSVTMRHAVGVSQLHVFRPHRRPRGTRSNLTALGLRVVRSDAPGFDVEHDRNAIETCLVRVRESDHFVCLLSQRYGPSLHDAGYDDVSATHLEYREARTHKKPVHFFVRDRLLGDHAAWKRAGKDSTTFKPVFASPKDADRLFALIDEHSDLAKDADASNWRSSFTSVVDLKASLERRLDAPLREARLQRLVEDGRLPLFSLRGKTGNRSPHSAEWTIGVLNVGSTAALDVTVSWHGLASPYGIGAIEAGASREARFEVRLPLPASDDTTRRPCSITFSTVYGDKLEAAFVAEIREGSILGRFDRAALTVLSSDRFELRANPETR